MIYPKLTLTVRDHDGNEVFTLSQSRGVAHRETAIASHEASVERWLTQGLLEWIGERGARVPRETPPSSPEFLPRLRDYLLSQFPSLSAVVTSSFEMVPELDGFVDGPLTIREPFGGTVNNDALEVRQERRVA